MIQIDPSKITEENIPVVLGVIITKLDDQGEDIRKIKDEMIEYNRYATVVRFSFCSFLPWIKRNKITITHGLALVTSYISILDWLNRWLQWSFLPPGTGP